jgi:hypothetical protein
MKRAAPLLLWAAALLPLASCSQEGAEAVDSAAAGGGAAAAPPLRILRAHVFDTGADHIEQLKLRVNGCRRAHGMAPVESIAVPPLAQLRATETEELFDGERHAVYRTTLFLAPDPANGCELVGLTQRSVDIETACGEKLRGMTTPTNELLDERDRKPFAVTIEKDPPMGAGCQKRQPAQKTAGLPAEPLPGGTSCVWNNAVAARLLDAKAAVTPGPTPDSFDVCLHAQRPVWAYSDAGGQPLNVVLRSHAPRGMEAVQAQGLSNDMAAEDLVSYAEGSAIPASRFTRGDAETFLNQPYKRSLGAGKS